MERRKYIMKSVNIRKLNILVSDRLQIKST